MSLRPSLRHKVSLFAILASLVQSHLTGLNWHAEENILGETALILAEGSGTIHGCTIEPEFATQYRFYTMNCVRTIASVNFFPVGEHIYAAGKLVNSKHPLKVSTPTPRTPHTFYLDACKSEMSASADFSHCTRYQFDVFRIGTDKAELATIAVTASGAPVMVEPPFSPSTKHYTASVEIDYPILVSAANPDKLGGVGIEWIGSEDGNGGLDRGDAGCENHGLLAASRSFHVKPIQATGEFKYKICAVAASGFDFNFYYLTIKTKLHYTAKLKSLDIGKFTHKMTPAFDSNHQDYIVPVPRTERIIKVGAKATDPQAGLTFKINEVEQDVMVDGEVPRGHADIDVKMPDNHNLKEGETPRWTRTVSVKVKSADDSLERHYIITLKEEVSSFCELANITIAKETPCTLDPPFNPKTFEYNCIWWWENSTTHDEIKVGGFHAIMNEEKCSHCTLLMPDHTLNEHLQLSWNAEADRVPFHSGEHWHRKFLYGESHVIPVQVVSQNKFTSNTYHVTLKRDAPWWMQTWLTRAVSHGATILAIFMAASSITNVMALAKQVQFMSLTCEIKGVPPVYADFAESLKSFNFDAFDYIPFDKLGIPTKKDFVRMKKAWIDTMKRKLGIEHATLLLQYCEARDLTSGLLYPNAILERDPSEAHELIASLQAVNEEGGDEAVGAAESQKLVDEEEDKKVRRMLAELFLSPYPAEESEVVVDKSPKHRRLAGTSSLRGRALVSNASWAGNTTRQLKDVVLDDYDWDYEDYDDIDLDAVSVAEDFDKLEAVLRRLDEDEKMTKEEKEKKLMTEFSKKLNWFHKDYKKLLELILKRGEWRNMDLEEAKKKLENKYPLVSCANKEIAIVEDGLLLLHQLFQIRKLLRTTTGTFIILSFMLLSAGSFYAFIYYTCLYGKQKRPRLLEPGPLLIFCLDYPLISFAKSSAKVAFHPSRVSLFSFVPPPTAVSLMCLTGLIVYPLAFIITIGIKIRSLMLGSRLIWNPDFEKYTDPRCSNVKIIMPPEFISPFIPVLPDIFTTQVRAAVPILDKEGN
jgi:hypothetical protein